MRTKSVDGIILPLTIEEEAEADARDAAHQLLLIERETTQYQRNREAAYNSRGATLEALTVALVESIAENRPEALQGLQVIRQQVKIDFPKPQGQ